MSKNQLPELSSIVIVGLARNCEAIIHKEIERINKAFEIFKAVSWIIIESDSIDNTVDKIKSISSRFQIELYSLGNLRKSIPKRTQRIAYCRNYYLKILKNEKYDSANYIAVVDLDGVNSDLTSDCILSCWSSGVYWDACFANQSALYYDIWALRHKLWSPNDCWRASKFLINYKFSEMDALNACVYSRMIKIDTDEKPISVDSAFGGLGIYKKKIIKDDLYDGLDEDGEEVCEHVSFHMSLKKRGAELYIIPALINGGWNEHSNQTKLAYRIKRIVKSLVLSIATKFISKEDLKRLLGKSQNPTIESLD